MKRPQSYVSVNVSAPQLNDQFVDLVLATVTEYGLDPNRLMLEITESMLVDDRMNARSILGRLREAGVRIAIDDFGTGFSSLSYFQSLCVDVVKIDRSFVRDLGTNADHQALTRTILSLADGFAMTAASTVPAIPQLVVGRPLGGLTYGYSPTSPSIASRMMSAWPRCRAYSSIMCTVTQRSVY